MINRYPCGLDIHFYLRLLGLTYSTGSRNSSVGRALDWRSKGPWFNPGFRQANASFSFFFFLPNISSFHHFFLSIYLSIFLSLFLNTLHNDVISRQEGGLAQMVERSLSMREVPGSIPGSSMSFFHQHQIENQPLFHNSPTIGQLSGWPSGLRRQTQGKTFSANLVAEWVFWSTNVGVGSNPTSDNTFMQTILNCSCQHTSETISMACTTG